MLSSCVRPSVCLSVRHKPVLYRNDWTNRADFWHGGFFLPTPDCLIRKIGYGISTNLATSLLNFVPNSGLSKFRNRKSIALSTKLVVVVVDGGPCDSFYCLCHSKYVYDDDDDDDDGACWRHLYNSRRVVAVYCESVNSSDLSPLLRFVVDLLYNMFLQLTRFWLTWRVTR